MPGGVHTEELKSRQTLSGTPAACSTSTLDSGPPAHKQTRLCRGSHLPPPSTVAQTDKRSVTGINGKFTYLGWNNPLHRHRMAEPRLGAVPEMHRAQGEGRGP